MNYKNLHKDISPGQEKDSEDRRKMSDFDHSAAYVYPVRISSSYSLRMNSFFSVFFLLYFPERCGNSAFTVRTKI